MQEFFAIKRPRAWLWWGKLTREEVLARLETGELRRDWLICPLGTAERAVTLEQFVDDPAIFLRLEQREAQEQNRRQAIAVSVEKPLLFKIGKQLLCAFFLCLVGGRATVNIFPQLRDGGLTPIKLTILIIIWSFGGVGLLALLVGWVHYRYRVYATLKQQMGVSTERTSDQIWD